MVLASIREVHEVDAADTELGGAVDTTAGLIAALKAQNKSAVRRQSLLLAVTVAVCAASLAIVLYSVRLGPQNGGHEGVAHVDHKGASLAGEWRAYNEAWEECARKPDCDAWNTTEANTLIELTRASVQDPDKINGVAPPGVPGLSTGSPGQPYSKEPSHKMLEYVGRQPVQTGSSTMYAVWYNSRRVMERTPIHVHPETQFTCILNGTLMFIAEGMETRNYTKGQCYVMPGMTKMVSVNVGDASYVDVDVFRVSAGSVPWVVVEPSVLWMQSTQFGQKDEPKEAVHGAHIHKS